MFNISILISETKGAQLSTITAHRRIEAPSGDSDVGVHPSTSYEPGERL